MIVKAFTLKCLTNMHVGNGDVNFNIIDNEVERNTLTKYPTIHSSGVKGAIREFMEIKRGKGSDIVNDIFGKEGKQGSESTPGKIRFLSANMLALPMRASDGDQPYYLVTTDKAIESYNTLAKSLGFKEIDKKTIGEKVSVEGVQCDVITGLEEFGIAKAALMNESDFNSENGQVSLPVLARNRLENGKSAQLWYEEVVPHETVFTLFVIANKADTEKLDQLEKDILSEPVQFGGNATIGYGLCKIAAVGGNGNE